MRNVYKQFLICQEEKDQEKIDRSQTLPHAELVKIYEHILHKNGDPDHDAAFDTFQMQEMCMMGIYWCGEEHTKEQRHMMLPYGTVITQAKDQMDKSKEAFQITVELPWGNTIRSNADLSDTFTTPQAKVEKPEKAVAQKKKGKKEVEFDEFMDKSKHQNKKRKRNSESEASIHSDLDDEDPKENRKNKRL